MRRPVKRRYHLRLPFWLYCGLTLLVALAAMNAGSNLLFWVFGLMASSLIVSGAVSGIMMTGLRVRRVTPAYGAAGEPMSVRYAVYNRNRLIPAFNVHFHEKTARAGAERPGWERLMGASAAWVMHLGPRETVHGEAIFRPERRGAVWFDDLQVWTNFPFGIVGKSVTTSRPQRILVYPRLYALRRRVLDAISPAAGVGTKVTKHPGAGDDYYGLREFRPGDSMRYIAWKRTANRDELVCIERTRPNPPKLRVVLNLAHALDGDTGVADLEEKAISLAASVVHAAEDAGFEVGLTTVGLGAAPVPVGRGHWHRNKIMAALAEIDLAAPRVREVPLPSAETERAGIVAVHADRVDPSVVRGDAWHFTARQLPHLVDLEHDERPVARGVRDADGEAAA